MKVLKIIVKLFFYILAILFGFYLCTLAYKDEIQDLTIKLEESEWKVKQMEDFEKSIPFEEKLYVDYNSDSSQILISVVPKKTEQVVQ